MRELVDAPDTTSTAEAQAPQCCWKPFELGPEVLLPTVLLRRQHDLGLTSDELTVLLNIVTMPKVATALIEKRSGISQRTVQRILQGLRRKGYVIRRRGGLCDLSGLLRELESRARQAVPPVVEVKPRSIRA